MTPCPSRSCRARAVLILVLLLFLSPALAPGQPRPANDPRAKLPDSYAYYGPNGLYKKFKDDPKLQLGRDTWIHWTWGNQKFLRRASVIAGNLPVPVSIDFFRILDSRNRRTRFRDLGLITEPNCTEATEPDRYGLWLDHFEGDPYGQYPFDPTVKPHVARIKHDKYDLTHGNASVKTMHYGYPSGILGLRLFKNPLFDKDKWKAEEYFTNPARVEPPYLVGFSCAFCHIAFDPANPPADPEKPRWENLAANIGNQYVREGAQFFGKGRIVFGDKNPGRHYATDPYDTAGLNQDDFLYHYGMTQQPGTTETSRISYDFINNPNTITPIYGLTRRPTFTETTPWGKERKGVWHALKDGADSVGPKWAVLRVPLNIGCEGDYWLERLFNPYTGQRQRPVRVGELLYDLSDNERTDVENLVGPIFKDIRPERMAELRTRMRSPYGNEPFGQDMQDAWRRIPALLDYLKSYEPSLLKDAEVAAVPAVQESLKDHMPKPARVVRGAQVFATTCARCHSSRSPEEIQSGLTGAETDVPRTDYRSDFLADELRYPVTTPGLGTNSARAVATNAVHGDVWDEFSSRDYKVLPPVGRLTLEVPVFPPGRSWEQQRPIRIEFDPPAGGRGYYRTPSLLSMWATAPYLHNNSVGDYYVYEKFGNKRSYYWVSNDGMYWRSTPQDRWERRKSAEIDYRIDTSVLGRLLMFEDGMQKLLNPGQRHGWVKRTTATSTLIPRVADSAQQLFVSITHDILQKEFRKALKVYQVSDAKIDAWLKQYDQELREKIAQEMRYERQDVLAALTFLQDATHASSSHLFDTLLESVWQDLSKKPDLPPNAIEQLRPALRKEFLKRVKAFDRRVQQVFLLQVPKGMPVNLYANLNTSATMYAALAYARHHDDIRTLAEIMLQLSDCPDLVEDGGHTYGSDLSDTEKGDLIEFLKTL
jgi:hypothetical protein